MTLSSFIHFDSFLHSFNTLCNRSQRPKLYNATATFPSQVCILSPHWAHPSVPAAPPPCSAFVIRFAISSIGHWCPHFRWKSSCTLSLALIDAWSDASVLRNFKKKVPFYSAFHFFFPFFFPFFSLTIVQPPQTPDWALNPTHCT
jgi:hypothetical protein